MQTRADERCRTVVEGENAYRLGLAPGGIPEQDEAERLSEEEETGAGVGTVYRVFKGQAKKLEGGMERYEELAARTAAKLGKTGK